MEFDLVQYYCREGYYRTMEFIANSVLQKMPNDAIFKFQRCVSLILQEELTEALKNLEPLSSNPNIGLAALLVMAYAQNQCDIPDEEALLVLDERLKIERKQATESALYYSANFFLQIKNFEKAQEYLDNLFRLNRMSVKGYIVKGWIEINNKRLTKAVDHFKNALIQEPQNLDAALGEVAALSAIDATMRLNQLIVMHPNLIPPLIEKMKLLWMQNNWDELQDIILRIKTLDPACIMAQQYHILQQICINSDYKNAAIELNELKLQFNEQEPKNWRLILKISSVLSRICGRENNILRELISMLENVVRLHPEIISLLIELGYEYYLCGNFKLATNNYKKAAKIDNSALEALIGLTKCNIIENGFNQTVRQQIDFLFEVHGKLDPTSELLLLQAECIANDSSKQQLIDKAIDMKFKLASAFPYGIEFLIALDPNFILEALQKYPASVKNHKRKILVLKKIIQFVPGLTNARLLLAKEFIDIEDYGNAEDSLTEILKNPYNTNVDANLMFAEILIYQKKFKEASSSLEQCLSNNLNVRLKPMFHLLNGIIQKHQKNYTECLNSFKTALNNISEHEKLQTKDLATLYLEMANCYQFLNRENEAEEAVDKASKLLEGTGYEDRISLAQVDLALCRHEYSSALSLLNDIPVGHSYYTEARKKMADIYLNYEKRKEKYLECYQHLADLNSTQENLIMLAEAYFVVRNINKSVETYELAIKQQPSPKLSCKLAQLYIKTHQYGKAITCYREAGSEGDVYLSELLLKLGQTDAAEIALANVPLPTKALLLSKVKEKSGDTLAGVNILKDAYEKLNRVNPSLSAQICRQIAKYETDLRHYEEAIKYYQNALSNIDEQTEEFKSIQIQLIGLFLKINDESSCQTLCSDLLSRDADNSFAVFTDADLSFRKCNFEKSNSLFTKLLKHHPNNWEALVRLIEIKRRMGIIYEVKQFLDVAAEIDSKNPGFKYCLGLYNWFNNNPKESCKNFNFAKHDPEFGQRAIRNMIEIYLTTPGQETLAQSLIKELRPNSVEDEIHYKLLNNFVLLSIKDKQAVDKAMSEFTLLASKDILRVGASLGLAMGYMLQKQSQRARNVLKIVAKTAWNYEEAEYLERCWIMLAEHYIQSNKFELANELIKRILMHNQSCYKTYEFHGIIMEKDQKFAEAIEYYRKGWTLCGQNDSNLGFKLATVLLKSKKYADTIDVCQIVFKNYPDSTKPKKEIYDKALSLLRT